jgi:N-acetylglucosaminyl-diphospho-decaprenol L-rhamnosyltransferase
MHRNATQQPMVTVAVVSWNTRELLLRCLTSLDPEVAAGRAQVWVVDNGSSDGSPQAAREHAPWAQVLEPGRNLGFGSAVNLVARRTQGEWLVAANADIALEPGALEALLAAGGSAHVGCVAPRLILPGGETQQSVHWLPTVPFALAFNLGLHRLSPRLADRLCLEGSWDVSSPRDVPWAIGALLLLRRAAFDAVGGFDERQWMYAEDLDIAWRLRAAGWTTRYEPLARVRHEASASTDPAFGDQKIARFMAATYAALLRRRGLARTWATAAINVAGAAARLVWMAPLARVSARWRGRRDVMRDWLAAHLRGLRPRAALLRDAGPPR